MDSNMFQGRAHETSHDTMIGGDMLLYPVLGLAGESGELLNKIKKIYRDSGGVYTHEDRNAVIDELGDILWYVSEVATQLGIELSIVAERNLLKLASRKQRGVISGSGDNR
jgi:NTP pyrophosphatase (non-canonical NTP hydrolase)